MQGAPLRGKKAHPFYQDVPVQENWLQTLRSFPIAPTATESLESKCVEGEGGWVNI